MRKARVTITGVSALVGGVLGLLLAPIMVAVKYQTGWAVIPEPAWIAPLVQRASPLFAFAAPPDLWTIYGMGYTAALLLMLPGVLLVTAHLRRGHGRGVMLGVWLVLGGYGMVIAGDAIHSLTWHQNGLTIPTPGTNPVANTAYATHMMGMNMVMVGSLVVGIIALRRRLMVRWLAWGLILLFPSAVVASITVLPTTPSGALWLLCLLMVGWGYSVVSAKSWHVIAA